MVERFHELLGVRVLTTNPTVLMALFILVRVLLLSCCRASLGCPPQKRDCWPVDMCRAKISTYPFLLSLQHFSDCPILGRLG